MPTYPYACTACGHTFEVHQSFSDPSLTECPECSGRLRKVFSSVGVVFKGSGFYRTDSRSGSSATVSGSDSGSGNGSGTDAKPAKTTGGEGSSSTPASTSSTSSTSSASTGTSSSPAAAGS